MSTQTQGPLTDLTGFQRDLLRTIAVVDSPELNGTRIKARLEAEFGAEITSARLYPNLDELAERGYVEKGQVNNRSNNYRITERGRNGLEAYAAWVSEAMA